MVTMDDVARLAGVSKMTVSNVVNNRGGVSEPVRRRVREAIERSGYRVNVSARTLRSGRTGVIGLAVPEIDRPYFGRLASHVIERARRRGFHVAIEQTGAAAAGEIDAIAHARTLQFDGLILSAVGLDGRDRTPPEGDHPIVMLGEQDFGGRFDHIAMPNEEATAAATAHLLDRGCRAVAHVTGRLDWNLNMVNARHRGHLGALAARGVEADPALHVGLDALTMEAGRAAAHRLAAAGRPFDGVLAVTDTVALGVLRGLADVGLRVPDDVRVAGFDDIAEAAYLVPALTTVAPDHAWMAEKAVELVTERIADPGRPTARYVAPYALVIRESTR